MKLMTYSYYGMAFQYNGGTFNANNGTVEFNCPGDNIAISLQQPLDLYNVNINNPQAVFTVQNNSNDFTVNGTLTLTNGLLGGASIITAKGDVLVKSTFGNRPGMWQTPGEIKTSGNVIITAEADSRSPAIELNTGATMNVDNAGASIIDLILNGGTFNAPTGRLKFLNNFYQGNALQYNGGTFNANNGTVEFNNPDYTFTVILQQPLDLYNVDVNNTYGFFYVYNNGNDFTVNGTLTLTHGGLGAASITAKGDVLVKSAFGNYGNGGDIGTIKTSANTTVTAEANSWAPIVELNAGAVMNVDNAGASVVDLILNGGTFNAPTGTMRFTAPFYGGNYGGNGLQYNSGIFNHNNGTVEFKGRGYPFYISLQQPLDLYNVNIDNPQTFFTVQNNSNDFNVNGTLTLTQGRIGNGSLITAKGDVLVKSTFGNRPGMRAVPGKITTSGNVTVTAEANSWSPTIELNTGAVMNVDNAGASIIQLILNGGTFNAPTGTLKFLNNFYLGNALQYNGGTFNANNGTVEFNNPDSSLTVILQQPLDPYNVDVNMGDPSYHFSIVNNDNDFNVNGMLTLSGGQLRASSLITAKGNVLVKSAFNGGPGNITINNNNNVTVETD
jgi:guanyl-specific ribonuclease Sa